MLGVEWVKNVRNDNEFVGLSDSSRHDVAAKMEVKQDIGYPLGKFGELLKEKLKVARQSTSRRCKGFATKGVCKSDGIVIIELLPVRRRLLHQRVRIQRKSDADGFGVPQV